MSTPFFVVYAVKSHYNLDNHGETKPIIVVRSRKEAEAIKKKICYTLYLIFPFKLMDEDLTYLSREFPYCNWSDCVDAWIKSIDVDECALMHTEDLECKFT